MLALLLSVLLAVAEEIVEVELAPTSAVSDTSAMMYLSQYGWLDPSARKPGSAALLDVRGAVKDFQAFAGLNQTGELDEETLTLMSMPRCGVRDKVGHDARRRKKRYALQGSRWKVRELSYKITKYPKKLQQDDVDREVANAFKIWEEAANISFHRMTGSGKVHIEIRFEKGEHGDGDAFDGEGGTLAHAYFPVYGGDAHFDEEEKWTVDSFRGTNLFQVAAHEFGHSLGLSHSDVRSSLMAPFYRGYNPGFKLDSDDVYAIQTLYGKRAKPVIAPTTRRPLTSGIFPNRGKTTPASPTDKSKICKDPKIDAMANMADGFTYVFKGSEYYRLTENGVADGYPRKISSTFGSLPDNLDAAFTWTNDRTYFFKGNKYWRFTDMTMDSEYPKDISDGFEGIPSNIDTAFVWSGNGKIYFFKGDKFWRFDPARRPPVSGDYPKPISNWKGVPNNVDAALRYSNGYTYFFKAGKYWRFNDRNFAVDTAEPAFPRPTAQWWYGCGNAGTSAMKNNPDEDYQDDKTGDAGRAGVKNSSDHVIQLISSHLLLTSLWIAFCFPIPSLLSSRLF